MAIVRLTVRHTYGAPGGPGINTWHFRTDGEQASEADMASASAALEDFYQALAVRFPTTSTFQMLQEGYLIGQQAIIPIPTWVVTGTAAGGDGYLPTPVAICLNWRTANISRRGKGRTFLGPLALNQRDPNGTPTLAAATGIVTAANALIAAFQGVGDGGAFGVYSEADGLVRDFTSATVRDSFAVLRSRRD